MKTLKTLGAMALAAVLFGMAFTSCKEDENKNPEIETGTVSGTVTSDIGSPIADVTVEIADIKKTATTDAFGSYKIDGVTMTKHSVTFKKDGFAETAVSITEKSFVDKVAKNVDAVMAVACAAIKGTTVDAKNGNAPLAGVTISLNGAKNIETGADGTFNFDNLTIDDYTLTFTKAGCVTVEKKVEKASFTGDFIVDLGEVLMGSKELLRGLTLEQIAATANTFYYNEYRGGKNGDDYPHFDWSSDFLGTITSHQGWFEEQNEGTAIQIRNREDDGDWNNPADLDVFDSYIYGKKAITADNCKMYLKVRTHAADDADPTNFGVMVIDPTAAEPEAVRIGDIRKYGNDAYTTGNNNDRPDFEFDLTPYIGKEIYFAIGTYRVRTGDYWKQLVLRRIVFAKECPSDWGWCPGEEVQGLGTNWKMTKEIVRSTMPITEIDEFSGISNVGKEDIDGPEMYRDAYQTWREQKHFAAYWACMPIHKDSEPFAGEGFVIKTNGGGTPVTLDEPQSYFYAKLPVNAKKTLFLKTRNFSTEHPTYFKVAAITEDCAVSFLEPKVHTVGNGHEANFAESVGNGAWKFINEGGGKDEPELYANFEYDLSAYSGKNVIIALAVFKGDKNDDENKMAIHSIGLK